MIYPTLVRTLLNIILLLKALRWSLFKVLSKSVCFWYFTFLKNTEVKKYYPQCKNVFYFHPSVFFKKAMHQDHRESKYREAMLKDIKSQ